MHCLCRVSLRVNAATSRTIARGTYRQAPSAATTYAPQVRYSQCCAIELSPSPLCGTELEDTAATQLCPPGRRKLSRSCPSARADK